MAGLVPRLVYPLAPYLAGTVDPDRFDHREEHTSFPGAYALDGSAFLSCSGAVNTAGQDLGLIVWHRLLEVLPKLLVAQNRWPEFTVLQYPPQEVGVIFRHSRFSNPDIHGVDGGNRGARGTTRNAERNRKALVEVALGATKTPPMGA